LRRVSAAVIAASEPGVAAAIAGELASQRRQLKLIASENYASPAVLLAMGNWLSDKYAEGTIGRRLYAGCEMVDRVEEIATGHACALFGAEHAYVQPGPACVALPALLGMLRTGPDSAGECLAKAPWGAVWKIGQPISVRHAELSSVSRGPAW